MVLHHPDTTLLRAQYDAVRGQVHAVLYVDNSAGQAALAGAGMATGDGLVLIGDGVNVGLAAALNHGLADVAAHGAGFALLLDQDSIPDPGMVATLHRLLTAGSPSGHPVAAIGPAIVDELHGRTEYFARLRLPLNHRIHPSPDAPASFEVDFLITSGTLLPLSVLDAVGGMDENLFIDSIDFDWSFRATDHGYALLATFATTMRHRRGDELHRVGPLSLRLHSPFRLFYMYRNRVRLYRRGYVPAAWKVHDLGRMLVKMVLLAVFVPGRAKNLSAIWRGIYQGLRTR